MQDKLPTTDWMIGTGLVIVAILSIFFGTPETTNTVCTGLVGFLGRGVLSNRR